MPLIVPPAILEVPCSRPQQAFFRLSQNIKYITCRARQSVKKFALQRTATSGPGLSHYIHSSVDYPVRPCGAPWLFRTLSWVSEEECCSICTCGSGLVGVKQCPMAKRSSGCSFLLPLLGHGLDPWVIFRELIQVRTQLSLPDTTFITRSLMEQPYRVMPY